MFESNFQEISAPSPGVRVRRNIPPFVKRRLIHVYHGRFCFKMPGVRCGPDETTWSRTLGHEEELRLAPSVQGISAGSFSVKHTFSETLSYKIGPRASTSPVWCHDDSELHIYESSSYLSEHLFRRRSRLFLPADPGFFAANYLNPDPECQEKRNGDLPSPGESGPSSPRIFGTSPSQATQLVEPVSFSRTEKGEEGEDPETNAAAAAQLLAEDLLAAIEPADPQREDWYRPGLVGLKGEIVWLDARPEGRPVALVPASAGCLARERGALSFTAEERNRPFPVLAFAGDTGASSVELSVVAEGAGGRGEVWSGEAVAREDGFELPGVPGTTVLTAIWGHADLSALPDGVSGSILGRAFDSSGDLVAVLALPFSTDEEPERVPATIRETVSAT